MRKSDVVKHFGSVSHVARIIGVSVPSISQWGYLVPMGRAYQIEKITNGALVVDPALYDGSIKGTRKSS